jgi:hypothetical protein
LEQLAADLQSQGAKSFDESWQNLLGAIKTKGRVAARFLRVKLLLALERGDSDEPRMTGFASVVAFDRRTYPALVKLHSNERSAILDERRNSRDCKA